MSNIVQVAESLIEPARTPFLLALGEQDDQKAYALFNREASFAAQALARNKFSMDIARSNPQSLISAIVNVAAIGISLNPAKKQAYLVPRKDGDAVRICLDIGYMGLVDLATQSGAVRWVQSEVVREGDTFRRNGIDKAPTHEFDPFEEGRNTKAILGVYAVAKTSDGDFLTHVMGIEKVYDIRDRSEAWKAYMQKKIKSCPWFSDEEEMVKKTCIKQAWKTWPRDETDDRMDRAIHYLNTEGGEGLAELAEGSQVIDGGTDQAPAGIKMPQRKSREATDVEPRPSAPNPTETASQATEMPADAPLCTDGERAHIKLKAGENLDKVLKALGIPSLEQLRKPQFATARKIAMEVA